MEQRIKILPSKLDLVKLQFVLYMYEGLSRQIPFAQMCFAYFACAVSLQVASRNDTGILPFSFRPVIGTLPYVDDLQRLQPAGNKWFVD